MTMRTTALAAVAIAAWLAPTTGNAAPINYNITISGGIPDCGMMRPLPGINQPCDTVITGSILVDSEGATFADQLLGFSLDVIPGVTYTLADTVRGGSYNTLQFDGFGVLTGFSLPMIVRFDNTPPAFLTQWAVHLYADATGGSYRFEQRADPYMFNGCRGCVAISVSVPEPGASWLLIPAVALTLFMGRRRRTRLA